MIVAEQFFAARHADKSSQNSLQLSALLDYYDDLIARVGFFYRTYDSGHQVFKRRH